MIGQIYCVFLSMSSHNSLQVRFGWEAVTDQDISEDAWRLVCTEAHRVTNSNTWKEFKWKVIIKFFLEHHK